LNHVSGTTIEALAPGKVVLWGEYAVLAGAPALVMAVDRYARCNLNIGSAATENRASSSRRWHFSSHGFVTAPVSLAPVELLAATPPASGSPAWTAWHVLRALHPVELPDDANVVIDTTRFYEQGAKLGLGSSAAVCVAVYAALCELLGTACIFDQVANIHHRLQGNRGSGIDVAAAWFGGLLRFERDADPHSPTPPRTGNAELPPELRIGFIWAGHPAATAAHLQRFADWRARGATDELDALIEASRTLFEQADLIAELHHYVECLDALDRAAGLAIYDAAHRELHRLAAECGVVYKPCGAGGGDIGAAFSYDPGALERFMTSARAKGFALITLETAAHGIQVRR
jgi:phosphomevalonate kinase